MWACQALNTEGNRELLVGVEVPRISADFPMIDLRKATRDLKNSTDSQKVTNLTVLLQAGGHVDVLLRTQNSSHFPKLVHSLENSLASMRYDFLLVIPTSQQQ